MNSEDDGVEKEGKLSRGSQRPQERQRIAGVALLQRNQD